jgi:GntR family transcriptional repressor for pyruvate dehydrogenase complex
VPVSLPLARTGVADRIIELLRHRVACGLYAQGERLPTERALAAEFGVSVPTIREAVRALSAAGLVEVRQGSGAYVRASTTTLIGIPLATIMQLESVGVLDVLSLLQMLDTRAATLAVERATDEEIARFRETVVLLAAASSAAELEIAARRFYFALADAAHDPLTAALIKFFGPLVVHLQIAGGGDKGDRFWRRWARNRELSALRLGILAALERRDAEAAAAAVAAFHGMIAARIETMPTIRDLRLADVDLDGLVSSLRNDGRNGQH